MRWRWPTSLPAGDAGSMFTTSFLSLCLRDVPHPPQSHRASVSSSACSARWSHGTGTLSAAAWHAYFIKDSHWILCVHQDTASPSCSVAHQSKEWRREDELGVWQANRTCQPASGEPLNYVFNLMLISFLHYLSLLKCIDFFCVCWNCFLIKLTLMALTSDFPFSSPYVTEEHLFSCWFAVLPPNSTLPESEKHFPHFEIRCITICYLNSCWWEIRRVNLFVLPFQGVLCASVRCAHPAEEVNKALSQISLCCPLLLVSAVVTFASHCR